MEKELKNIVESCGVQIFGKPKELLDQLRAAGCPEKDVMITGLILTSCPSVGALLIRGNVSQPEGNALISAVVDSTELSVRAARVYLKKMMSAASIPDLWTPHLMTRETRPKSLTPMAQGEEELTQELIGQLKSDEDHSEAIRDLNVLSEGGNIHASYALGMYFKAIDDVNETDRGREFFIRAANQGYGPANGALADYEIRGARKKMTKAAKYFENPTTLPGRDGREWAKLSAQMLTYREDNSKRIKSTIVLQVLLLAMAFAVVAMNLADLGIFSVIGLVVQGLGLGWSLVGRIVFGPYISCRTACYAALGGWLATVLGLIL